MEAYELPKLMPTTGGSFETTAIGSSALPFGTAISSLVVLVQGFFQQKKIILNYCTWDYDHVVQPPKDSQLSLCSRTLRLLMACTHLGQLTRLSQPRLSQSVHREECTQCFDDQVRVP